VPRVLRVLHRLHGRGPRERRADLTCVARLPRIAGSLGLLAVAAFCVYGFLASLELSPSDRLPWQVGYGVTFHLALGGAVLLLIRPRDGEQRDVVAGDPPDRGDASSRLSWQRAVALAVLVTYAPFVAMATFMQLAVSHPHCQETAWRVLPVGPGLLPSGLVWNALDLSAPTEGVSFALASALCLCFVATIAALAQRGGRWRFGTAAIALAAFTLVAVGTYHAIRM